VTLRKIVIFGTALVIPIILGASYIALVQPAQAREVKAACEGILPSASNKRLGAVPTRAPDFTAQDHTGKMVKLSDFRGKVVVLRFWASWCETCRAEQPSLEALAGDVDPDDVEVLSVASDGDWEKVRKKLPGGSNTHVLIDPPAEEGGIGPIGQAYGVEKVPESFLIDRDGIVRRYLVNKRDWRNVAARTCLRSILDGQT
jgi:cytochrome c biogenesis protein CcmG, thiol:disulfide interchange protein DsbE